MTVTGPSYIICGTLEPKRFHLSRKFHDPARNEEAMFRLPYFKPIYPSNPSLELGDWSWPWTPRSWPWTPSPSTGPPSAPPHPVYAVLGTEARALVHTGATELYSQLYNRVLLCISNLCTSASEKGTLQIFLTFFLFLVGILITHIYGVQCVISTHTQTCYIMIINIAGDVHHLS